MVRIVKKPEERRREIISASRSLFLDQGYEKTTMQDIMTKLQIAKGTTYHYFKSKEELLDAVVAEMVDEYIDAVEKSLRECKGNAFEKMQTIVKAGRVVSPSTSHVIEALHRSDNRELHARLLAVTIIKLAPFYAQIISQGCEEGVFHVDHPLECAEVLIAGIQFVTDMGCHSWSPEDLERRIQAIPSLIESQLNAPKGTFKNLF
jgi:AcrR family transcriptional regulator